MCITSVLQVYYKCTTRVHVLQVYYTCATNALQVYYKCTTSVLQVCYTCTTSVLHVYYKCTTSVLQVYYKCTTSALQVYYKCIISISQAWCKHITWMLGSKNVMARGDRIWFSLMHLSLMGLAGDCDLSVFTPLVYCILRGAKRRSESLSVFTV